MLYESSQELWEMFDIVVGRNIRKIDEDQMVQILHFFSQSPYKRDKLFQLFVHKIQNSDLSISQNCALVRVYGEIGYSKPDFYELMDKRLMNKIFQMSSEDVSNALIGFLNPNMGQQFKIVENLETHIDEVMSKVSLKNATLLLIRYGQMKKGSETLVHSCLNRVNHQLKETMETVTPMDALTILYAYKLVGADVKYYYPLLIPLRENLDAFDYQTLLEINNILYQFKDDEKFVETFIEFKYQIDRFNPDGTKKQVYQ